MSQFELLSRYGPRMLEGLLITIELVAISVTLGALIAVPVALARLSASRMLRALALGYSFFFRGTPLLAQLFLVYYGSGEFRSFFESIGLWWLFRDAFFCALLTFTLNTGAYQSEILRGAIRAVPRGQSEAAMSLGMKPRWIMLRVVLPQALVIGLRPLGNEVILMIKGSAVAAIITVFDLMGATRLAFARSFDITVYLYAAVLYLVLVETLRRLWDILERRLTRHVVRAAP
ncbi:ABC transporter permease [Bauldia litoralis]|uniref:Polar amino acid transport system permease protein n=1 Tax=Bauldia litoralis TaxID=665467 RepID=A0A1G6CGZ3_9HYPH|nr:ABC transporter permease [Bauldia litoralis]SDB32012.1 polar amino acid transport system permease protein [Bauldia litoralis]